MENSAAYNQYYLNNVNTEINCSVTNIEISKDKKYLFTKRLSDIILSFSGLILLSPLLLITALVIFIDDPHGNPIYSQKRVGKNGKQFRFWKFRSMIVGADDLIKDIQHLNEKDGPVFKIKSDPRITRVGKIIRKTSIDELPQLVNVLKGEMSIVGPRPPLPREVEKYGDYEKNRLLVKPGLTCYWQVQQNRDNISFKDWMQLDLLYIQQRNLKIDLKLILDTVKVVFTGQGE